MSLALTINSADGSHPEPAISCNAETIAAGYTPGRSNANVKNSLGQDQTQHGMQLANLLLKLLCVSHAAESHL